MRFAATHHSSLVPLRVCKMKKCIILVFLIIFLAKVFSQIDSTRFDFYPIHIGDSWQYIEYSISYDFYIPDTFDISYHIQEITKDTMMSNGKIYYCSFHDLEYGEVYRRVDSLNYLVLEYDSSNHENNYETVIFDLSVLDSERWEDGRGYYHQIRTSFEPGKVGEIDIDRIQTTYSRDIALGQTLSQGFGISWMWAGDAMVQFNYYLTWARINGIEYGKVASLANQENNIPEIYLLYQNYPNPFNDETVIKLNIYKESDVSLSIYDIRGRFIENIISQRLSIGKYAYRWNAKYLGSGLYLYQLKTENGISVRKCLLIK